MIARDGSKTDSAGGGPRAMQIFGDASALDPCVHVRMRVYVLVWVREFRAWVTRLFADGGVARRSVIYFTGTCGIALLPLLIAVRCSPETESEFGVVELIRVKYLCVICIDDDKRKGVVCTEKQHNFGLITNLVEINSIR